MLNYVESVVMDVPVVTARHLMLKILLWFFGILGSAGFLAMLIGGSFADGTELGRKLEWYGLGAGAMGSLGLLALIWITHKGFA